MPTETTSKVLLTLSAVFSRASTTVDGGWRISFDLDQSQSDLISRLSELRDRLLTLSVEEY